MSGNKEINTGEAYKFSKSIMEILNIAQPKLQAKLLFRKIDNKWTIMELLKHDEISRTHEN